MGAACIVRMRTDLTHDVTWASSHVHVICICICARDKHLTKWHQHKHSCSSKSHCTGLARRNQRSVRTRGYLNLNTDQSKMFRSAPKLEGRLNNVVSVFTPILNTVMITFLSFDRHPLHSEGEPCWWTVFNMIFLKLYYVWGCPGAILNGAWCYPIFEWLHDSMYTMKL